VCKYVCMYACVYVSVYVSKCMNVVVAACFRLHAALVEHWPHSTPAFKTCAELICSWTGLPATCTPQQVAAFYDKVTTELLSWRVESLRLLSVLLGQWVVFQPRKCGGFAKGGKEFFQPEPRQMALSDKIDAYVASIASMLCCPRESMRSLQQEDVTKSKK
jgi:hypothetical protein